MFRDNERAQRDRIAALEVRAAQADRLAARVRELEAENARLRDRLAALEPPPVEMQPPQDSPSLARGGGRVVGAKKDTSEGTYEPAPWLRDIPGAAEALDNLDWMLLLETLIARAGAVHAGHERCLLLIEQAQIYQHQLADLSRAIDCCHQVLEIDPGHERALELLAHLYEQSERWEDMMEVLERAEDVNDSDAQRVASLIKRARIAEDFLAHDELAVDLARRVLDLDPENEVAQAIVARLR